MEKDPVLEKYKNEGFGKNSFGWYFNPWLDEYDPEYDPHNDKEYNEELNKNKKDKPEKDNSKDKPEEENFENKLDKTEEKNEELESEELEENNKEKIEVKVITIDPIKNKISYMFNNIKTGVNNCKYTDKVSFNYRDEQLKNLAEVVKRTTKRDDIDFISKALDPDVLKWLAANNQIFDIQINDYLDMLKGKNTSFEMIYDLRNIYDSSLDYNQIRNLNRISKTAKKFNPEKVVVKKDKLKDRFIGNIKKRYELPKQERIEAPKKWKRKIKGFNKAKRFFTKEPTMVAKIKNISSNLLTGVKEKINGSRNLFADKLKVNPSPIKNQNENINQPDEIEQGFNYILYDVTYYDEK